MPRVGDDEAHVVELADEGRQLLKGCLLFLPQCFDLLGPGDPLLCGECDGEGPGVEFPAKEDARLFKKEKEFPNFSNFSLNRIIILICLFKFAEIMTTVGFSRE